MASIKDVAKAAGVGVGTVSRMLNDSGYVSAEAREKIEAAMKELNYTPNELARNLYRKKTGIIAVLVPNVSNPFFAAFIDNVEAELYKAGFKVMLCNTIKDTEAEAEYLDMLNRHIVDGVISGVSALDESVYSKIHKPIVAIDRYLGEDIPVVTVDHLEGGRMAAEALIASGCRKVLHFRGNGLIETPYHDRHYEFQRVMEESGIETCVYDLDWRRMDTPYYVQVVDDVFEKGIVFDGVFGVDRLAIECMNRLLSRQVRIPEDVKIVAYDGTFITELTQPKITSVVQPIEELACESAKLICDLVGGARFKNRQVILKTSLRQGGTTLCSADR